MLISRRTSKFSFTIAQFSTEAITPQNKNYAQANTQTFVRNKEPILLITRDFPDSRVIIMIRHSDHYYRESEVKGVKVNIWKKDR